MANCNVVRQIIQPDAYGGATLIIDPHGKRIFHYYRYDEEDKLVPMPGVSPTFDPGPDHQMGEDCEGSPLVAG